MRFAVILMAALLGLGAPAAAQPTANAFWSTGGERLSFKPLRLTVPRRVGTAEYFESAEFSRRGEGLDTAVKFRTADRKLFATLYVYYPGVAHTGLQAISTDQAIRLNSKAEVRPLGRRTVAAAGREQAAIEADYSGYLGNLYSKAAFVKAGRWMVKLRVSGPEDRRSEVSSVMSALLDGLRFEGDVGPHPAQSLDLKECALAADGDARLLSDDDVSLLGPFLTALDASDGAQADSEGNARRGLSRIGRDWCRSTLVVGDARVPVISATGDQGGGLGGKSALFVLHSDAGGMLEVVRLPGETRFLLLNHGIGETSVLGTYDAVPSFDQIRMLFTDPGEHGRVRAKVRLIPGQGTELEIIPPAGGQANTRREG